MPEIVLNANISGAGAYILPFLLIGILAALAVFFAVRSFMLTYKYKSSGGGSKSRGGSVLSFGVGKVHEQGRRRYQQDSFGVSDMALVNDKGLLAIVADGMGGLDDSGKISSRAVERILDGFAIYNGSATQEQLLVMLAQGAVEDINGFLGEENFRKSGSTLIMAYIKNSYLSFLSIGDSRVCLLRDGVLYRLNREHIFKNELALRAVNGRIPLADAYTDKNAAGLTSYIGMGNIQKMDIPSSPIRLYPGDRVAVMTDGIYNSLSDAEISAAISGEAETAAQYLKDAVEAKVLANQDNYTCVVIECR